MKSTHGKRSMWARGALAGAAALLLAQGAAAQQAEGTLPEVRVLGLFRFYDHRIENE